MGFFVGAIVMLTQALSANTFILVRIMEFFWFFVAIVVSILPIEAAEVLQKKEAEMSSVVAIKTLPKTGKTTS